MILVREQPTKWFNMFNIECILYLLIILYSLFYQLYVIVLAKKNSHIEIKDGSGLFVSKDVLNENKLGTLYVTKTNGKWNDHYDIGRNVIRLSKDVYDEENLSSMAISLYQVVKAVSIDKEKRKEEKTKMLVVDYANKIFFVLFIIAVSSKALDIMSLSLIDIMSLSLLVMIIALFMKYNYMTRLSDNIVNNIKYLKKSYKLKEEMVYNLEKQTKAMLYNELSLHIFNNKY